MSFPTPVWLNPAADYRKKLPFWKTPKGGFTLIRRLPPPVN
jgi:hypothetical protein